MIGYSFNITSKIFYSNICVAEIDVLFYSLDGVEDKNQIHLFGDHTFIQINYIQLVFTS